jgi:hypothetical protein
MVDQILGKLRSLGAHKWVVLPWAIVAILLFVVGGVTLHAHNSRSNSNVVSAGSSGAKIGKSGDVTRGASTLKPTTRANKSSTPAPTPGSPQTAVVKTVTNSDGTITKEINSSVAIAFSSSSQNDSNLKRGTTKVVAGQNGIQTTVYSVTYDQSGKEIVRKTLSQSITKQPIDQITRVGISDYNLNTDTWDGTGFGELCTPADHAAGPDGCVGTPSDRYLGVVVLSGANYVRCISDISGICNSAVNIQPIIAVHADNTFVYQGTTYVADIRAGGGESQLLTPGLCSQYGLACGSW